MTDHISIATDIATALRKSKDIANVTDAQLIGQRNPRAAFTVVGNDGCVCAVEVKRLMMGQALTDLRSIPALTHPTAKAKRSK